jgi:hypothetical protein
MAINAANALVTLVRAGALLAFRQAVRLPEPFGAEAVVV